MSPACSDVTKLPAAKPEILVGSVLDAGSGSEPGSEKAEESGEESPNPRRGLLGIFSRSEAKEKISEESTQSPVEREALLSGVKEFDHASSTGSLQQQTELPSQQTDQSEVIVASISDAKSPRDAGVSKLPRTVSPKPQFFGIFCRGEAKEKSPETERAVENETTLSEDRRLDDVISTSQTDSTTALQYQHETDIESDETQEKTKVLQPEFLSEDAIQSASSVVNKVEHEVVESEVEADEFLKKLSNLKSFWERQYSGGPKILIAKPSSDSKIHTTSGDHFDQMEDLNEDPPKIETTEASSRFQSPPLDHDSSGMTTPEQADSSVVAFSQPPAVAHPENPPPVESSVLLNIPSADGTFTARPILICDETDSSPEEAAADSQVVTQPQDDASSPVRPLSPSPKQKGESETVSHVRPLSPAPNTPKSRIPKPKDASDDELRKSPSKTCHPKALPREVTNCKGSNAGSPLKTFPIDIATLSKELEEESENQTVSQRKSPSHEAKQALKSILKIPSSLPQYRQEQFSMTQPRRGSDQSALSSLRSPSRSIAHPGRRTSLGNLNLSSGLPRGPNHRDPTARRTSEGGVIGPQLTNRDLGKRKSSEDTGVTSHLAKSFIPQIVRRVDTTPQGTDVPPFLQERQAEEPKAIFDAPAASVDVRDRGFSPAVDSEESQDTSTTESLMLNVDGGSSGGGIPKVQSRAGRPCSYNEDASPLRTKLKAMPQRPMSFSKSLEDLTSRSSTLPPRPPSLSDSEDMKMISASVSALPQEEKDGRDSDCTSESSLYLGWRRNANSLCNLSLSSGMAGSMVSIYSGEHGDVEVKGSIQLALNYVQKLGEFHIFVVHCRELAVADPKKSRSNPYIKCYLLPDKAKMGKKKTSVKNKTLNPTYNEILRFKVTMETLKTQKLNVSVWHNDNFGRNSFLGELELDLTEWDFNNTQINEYTLKPRVSTLTHSPSDSQSVDGRGEMRVALRFLPRVSYSKRPSKLEAGEMQVWVKDCKNLPPVRGVIIDPFVKCAVLPDSGRRTRQKTRVVKRTTSPMFNHTMVYDGFRSDDLREIAMEITVWDHDRLSNHFIGGLRIGLGSGRSYGADVAWMDSTAEEARLWERMMQAQSEWVEAVLPLRMLLMARAGAK
ncbi:synaptotagmin-like protein 2 isoform X2 [Osmerus eperlanus]|uniref:synaptotagmin-like protein 2 isoform X2 n=1 Tax=Osmerus eperlanus TaxID=29151 RepID=UPI002E13C21B